MKNNFTVGVDIDGVVRDWSGELCKVWEELTGEHKTFADLKDFDLRVSFPHPHIDVMKVAFGLYNFRISLEAEPIPGAIEAIQQMYADGIRIVFLSHQYTPNSCEWTTRWLTDHHVPFNGLFYLRSKQTVDCDLYVDDGPKYIQDYWLAEKKFVIYDAPYNQGEPGLWRVSNWIQLEALIRREAGWDGTAARVTSGPDDHSSIYRTYSGSNGRRNTVWPARPVGSLDEAH